MNHFRPLRSIAGLHRLHLALAALVPAILLGSCTSRKPTPAPQAAAVGPVGAAVMPKVPVLAWEPLPPDPDEEAPWHNNLYLFRLACNQHVARDCYTYGYVAGITPSGVRAVYHACELGHAGACEYLAEMVGECDDHRAWGSSGQRAADEQCLVFRKMFGVGPPPPPVPVPAPAPPPLKFVMELPEEDEAKLFPLPSGVALFVGTMDGWQLQVAHGKGALTPVAPLLRVPESQRPHTPLFVGGLTNGDLFVSLFDEHDFPLLRYVTLHVAGTTVTRIRDKWFRSLGAGLALPSSQNPAMLVDDGPQKFEQITPGPWLPLLPPDLRLFDVDILPSSEVHALGILGNTSNHVYVGWVAPPDGPARTLSLAPGTELGTSQPVLVHGSTAFLAYVEGFGAGNSLSAWLSEVKGHLEVGLMEDHLSAAASAGTEVWFAAHVAKKPVLRHRTWSASTHPADLTTIPMPSPAELAAAGASEDCQTLSSIDELVALPDGNVWLRAHCLRGGKAILRVRSPASER